MLSKEVQNYIASAKGLPFFYVTGDSDYNSTLAELKQAGLSVVRMSDLCYKDDKFPSIDDLIDNFRTSDIDYRDNKFVVIGLGEFLAIKGEKAAERELNRLKATTLGTARVVLLLRGVSFQANAMISDDGRILSQQRAYVSENTTTNISIVNLPFNSGMVKKDGIKALLKTLEDGVSGSISVSTELYLDAAIFPVTTIASSHAILNMKVKQFNLPVEIGTEEQWAHLLKDVRKNGPYLTETFSKYEIDDSIFDNLYEMIAGIEYKNWLVFLYCKHFLDKITNKYLQYVIENTTNYEDFKNNILTYIINIPHADPDYQQMYDSRKRLIRQHPEEDFAVFIKANEADQTESIYRFTDTTFIERKAVIKWIAHNGLCDAIQYVYPALYDYLKKYNFTCHVLADELTRYIDAYKQQKVTNKIDGNFLALVEEYADRYLYAQLPTRDSAIQNLQDKKNTCLYWIDALGVEYLSYIEALAKRKGLSIHVDITRADLPTITKVNKRFYEEWTGGKKHKEDALDEIKHKEKGGFFFTDDQDPIHLPAELSVIERAISTAATQLAMHECKYFVIASDHGASRLAVIRKHEIPYETDTKGEHSGRCCVAFEGCDAPYKVEENGYIALSDYGRFRKSRAANVEVHGGATLEEVVVPVITLTLKKASSVEVKLQNKNDIVLDRRKGVSITLYISDVESDTISIMINDKRYVGVSDNGTYFTFYLSDIKRAKTYTADVFDSEDLIGTVLFTVKGKTGSVNDDFDSLF